MKAIEYHTLAEECGWLTTRSVNLSPIGVSRMLSIINSQQSLKKYFPYFYGLKYDNSASYYMGSKFFYLQNEPEFIEISNNTLIPPNLFNWYESFAFLNGTLNQYAIDTLISILTGIPELSVFLQSLQGITPENCFEYRDKIADMYRARYIFLQSLAQVIPDEENKA
jgi:hypothetical protein